MLRDAKFNWFEVNNQHHHQQLLLILKCMTQLLKPQFQRQVFLFKLLSISLQHIRDFDSSLDSDAHLITLDRV